jgi:hypothetical protein
MEVWVRIRNQKINKVILKIIKQVNKIFSKKSKLIQMKDYLKDIQDLVKNIIDLRKKEKENYKWHLWMVLVMQLLGEVTILLKWHVGCMIILI